MRSIFPYPEDELCSLAKIFSSQDTVPESMLRRSARIAARANAATRGTGRSVAGDDHTQQCAAVTKKHKMDTGVSSAVPDTETEVILIEDDEDGDDTLHEVSALDELHDTQEPSSTAQAEGSTSLLLTLPGELRNRIYRFALCQNHSIWITRLTWPTHQPALLKTNRQIRTEATRLFYHGNVFSAGVHDWDDTVQERFLELRQQYQIHTHWHHHFTGEPHWKNLFEWLKGVHTGAKRPLPSPQLDKKRSPTRWALAACFETALYGRDMPWFALERVLQVQRKVLTGLDSRWGIER